MCIVWAVRGIYALFAVARLWELRKQHCPVDLFLLFLWMSTHDSNHMTFRMIAPGDSWQVHNSVSSNWATRDFYDQSQQPRADRLVMRGILLIHHAMSATFGFISSGIKVHCGMKSFLFLQTGPLLWCRGTAVVQLSEKIESWINKRNSKIRAKTTNRPFGYCDLHGSFTANWHYWSVK